MLEKGTPDVLVTKDQLPKLIMTAMKPYLGEQANSVGLALPPSKQKNGSYKLILATNGSNIALLKSCRRRINLGGFTATLVLNDNNDNTPDNTSTKDLIKPGLMKLNLRQ